MIGAGAAAFISLLGFVTAISPVNRERLFRPDPEALREQGHDAATIQAFVDYAATVDETQFLAVASIYIVAAIALVFGAMRYKWGFAVYMVAIAIMQVAWMTMGLFNPMQLILPTVVMVMAMFNREILR